MIPVAAVFGLAGVALWQRQELRRLARENDYLRRELLHAQTLAGLR